MKDDRFYYVHMLECISNILEDTAGRKENFVGNRTIRHAVMHNLRLLAESSKRVSDEERERHPEIPWRDLADFRNVVVHDYLKIDYEGDLADHREQPAPVAGRSHADRR